MFQSIVQQHEITIALMCVDSSILFCADHTIIHNISPTQLITHARPPRDMYVSGKSKTRARVVVQPDVARENRGWFLGRFGPGGWANGYLIVTQLVVQLCFCFDIDSIVRNDDKKAFCISERMSGRGHSVDSELDEDENDQLKFPRMTNWANVTLPKAPSPQPPGQYY